MEAKDLTKGDFAEFEPNSKGGVPGKRPEITGIVVGKTKSQLPAVPNVIIETGDRIVPVRKSLGGRTKVSWLDEK